MTDIRPDSTQPNQPSQPTQPSQPNQMPPFAQAPQAPQVPQVPLDQPYYGITFIEAIKRFFRKYAVFTGRASRSEFWWSILFTGLVSLVITAVLPESMDSTVSRIWDLAVLIPTLAVAVRRLHDSNKSAWWIVLPYGLEIAGLATLIIGVLGTATSLSSLRYYGTSTGDLSTSFISGLIIFVLLFIAAVVAAVILMTAQSNPAGVRFDAQPVGSFSGYVPMGPGQTMQPGQQNWNGQTGPMSQPMQPGQPMPPAQPNNMPQNQTWQPQYGQNASPTSPVMFGSAPMNPSVPNSGAPRANAYGVSAPTNETPQAATPQASAMPADGVIAQQPPMNGYDRPQPAPVEPDQPAPLSSRADDSTNNGSSNDESAESQAPTAA